MGEPPAVMVRAFKPQGDLQLHRLGERARFRCARCQKDKATDLVATMGGDWAKKVCQECYGLLVHEQRESAKGSKNPGEKTLKAARGNARKAVVAQRRAAEDRARLPGAYGLLEFLRPVDERVRLVDGCLRINGERIRHVDQLPRPETLEWRKAVDKIVVEHLRAAFIKAVEDNARFGKDLRTVPRWSECGFWIIRGGVSAAIIHPTRAYISDGKFIHAKVIHANFMTSGRHWQQVADALYGVVPDLSARKPKEAEAAKPTASAVAKPKLGRAAGRRQIDQLPGDLAPERIAACLDASRRIRLERHLAYPRPVVLECDGHELTLLPIAGTVTRLLVPFRLRTGTVTLEGDLILRDRDPQPLLIGEDVPYEQAITAWIWALLGFADATCVEREPMEPTARRELAGSSHHQSAVAADHHHRPSVGILQRKSQWPRHLEPVGRWTSHGGSIVAAHLRHLPDGQTARHDAQDRARQVGIILRLGETWVKAHIRGVPESVEMRFRWHAPTELPLLNT
jgi:hypothetical protein